MTATTTLPRRLRVRPDILDPADLALVLGTSVADVIERRSRGHLPPTIPGSPCRWSLATVQAWVKGGAR